MRTFVRLLPPALVALLVLAAWPAPPGSAVEPETGRATHAPPVLTRYVGTFNVYLRWSRFNDYGEGNYGSNEAEVAVSGTLPTVRFSDSRLLGSSGSGQLNTTGKSSSRLATGDGDTRVKCEGTTINPPTQVPPLLLPVQGKDTFYAFNSLSAPMTCKDSSRPGHYEQVEDLPALPISLSIKPSEVGRSVIVLPVNRTVPKSSCPRYDGTSPGRCVYRLKGTLTLRLVPDVDSFQAPARARLDRAASRATVSTRCGTNCTATVTVRPLRGGGSATRRSTLQPRAARTITVPLAPTVRRAVLRSGGVRLTVTYRAGDVTKTYAQRLRV